MRASFRALKEMDVAARSGLVASSFDGLGIEGLVVSKAVNIRWLSGFTGSNGNLLLTADASILVTDGRYEEQAAMELAAAGVHAQVEISRQPWAPLKTAVGSLKRLGIESHHLTVDRLAALASAFPSAELVSVGDVIDRQRQTKDSGEQSRLELAAAIADEALRLTAPNILAGGGMSERSFARDLENHMFDLGADGISFDTIVASGPNSARPHARPSGRTISPGDLVVVDFGAAIEGYGSDITRTFVCGAEPTAEQSDLYQSVRQAQAAGVAVVRDGVEQLEVDRACRDFLKSRNLGEAFVHGTGHGIGLEIHEQPILSVHSVGILLANQVVTVEPGAYLPGFGGVRVEDSVVVTRTGCTPITLSPKGLVPTWQSSQPTT